MIQQEDRNHENIYDNRGRCGHRVLHLSILCKQRKGNHGRIHKSASDKKICGVCGGIAEWLGVDPTIIRIAWALLACGWGTGVLLYFICAFVLPEE